MDPGTLVQGFALLSDAERLRVVAALTVGVALIGAALPWPRRRTVPPKPQPILRLRRPDLPWRLTTRGPVEVPANARWLRRR